MIGEDAAAGKIVEGLIPGLGRCSEGFMQRLVFRADRCRLPVDNIAIEIFFSGPVPISMRSWSLKVLVFAHRVVRSGGHRNRRKLRQWRLLLRAMGTFDSQAEQCRSKRQTSDERKEPELQGDDPLIMGYRVSEAEVCSIASVILF